MKNSIESIGMDTQRSRYSKMYLNIPKFDQQDNDFSKLEQEGPVDIPTVNNFKKREINPMGWSFNKFSNINIQNSAS